MQIVFSDEISAVKMVNDDIHSELLSPCGYRLKEFPGRDSRNRAVKDVSNWQFF